MNANTLYRVAHLISAWLVVVLFLTTAPARADLAPDTYSSTTIEDASVSASKTGGTSVLRLRIIDEGTELLIFFGVQSGNIEGSRILV